MDLMRHLRFFAAVADARHFGHAAQDLGMTQPPLSQGIQRLERHLGVRLFDRDARGVRITDAGLRLLPGAREMLNSADDLERRARDLAEPTRVRVGIASDLGAWTTRLLARLTRAGFDIDPEVAGSVALVDRLHDGLLDVAVVRHPGVIDGLTPLDVRLVQTRLRVAPPDQTVSLAACPLPLVVPPRHHQPPAHDQLIDALRRAGHSGEVIECDQPVQRDALVAAGRAAELTLDLQGPELKHLPLRVRVVMPHGRAGREGVECVRVASLLDAALVDSDG